MWTLAVLMGCPSPCGPDFPGPCRRLDGTSLCYSPDGDYGQGPTFALEYLLRGLQYQKDHPEELIPPCIHARVLRCDAYTVIGFQDLDGASVSAFDNEGRLVAHLFDTAPDVTCHRIAVGDVDAAACMDQVRDWLEDTRFECLDPGPCGAVDYCDDLDVVTSSSTSPR